MEAVRRVREHDLLGHAPRDPFSGEEVRQRIGTDFSDVFGGPPRRFSLCETRSSLGESVDDSESGGRLEVEDAGESSQLWSPSLAEKPVFGGFSSPAHRRHLGDDFFSDIFRGNESPCSTPRKLDRERFASTPTSSFLIPSRPLPPTADIFGGDPSTPNLSYSSRLAKNFDYSPVSSPTSRASQKNEESTPRAFDVPPLNSPSRLNHETDGLASNTHRAPPSHRPAEAADVPVGDGTRGAEEPPMKEDSSSKDNSGSDHLHFSMYKWASKGVTLVMPPNLKERTKGRSRLSGVYAQVSQQPDLPLDKENLPQGIPTFHNQGEPDKTLFGNPPPAENNKVASPKEVAEVLRDITDQSDDAGVCGKDGSGFSVETRKPGLKNLRPLIDDDVDKEGNEDTSRHAKEREGMATDVRRATKGTDSTAKPKQGTREDPASDSYEKTNLASHRPVRTKGKVKESVKNFEARRLGLRENMKGRVEDRPSAQEVKEDEDKGNYEASSVPVAPTGQNLKAERADSFKNLGEQKLDGFFSEMDSTSVTFSDTTINSLDAFFCKIEVTDFEHVEDCLFEDLSQEHNEATEADLHQEEIKKSDAKILEWSKGREGNIRSLLSTLQYVLWPGSGWKPVPLVDIIEAPSVRRAYQRALLYIHPDKLQQKSADIHRKYVAEKVFDILQEAWDHFNSLGAL